MNKLFVIFFAATVVCLTHASEKSEVQYSMRMLTVRGETEEGRCLKLPFSLKKTKDDVPLMISISEGTPSGSGASIRSSVWLAAMTAAICRNDVMRGVRISVDFTGMVDGPSAGGMICLGILTALDGRKMPEDFAMTGTIMPDGTVGLVGGVAAKLKAATACGVQRVCIPAFLRFELQKDGSNVDLFREGERLGIKVYPVTSIADAYNVLHSLSLEKVNARSEHDIIELPKKAEDVLVRFYTNAYEHVVANMKNTSEEELVALLNDPLLGDFYNPSKASDQFNSGLLLSGTFDMIDTKSIWETRLKNQLFFASFYKAFPALAKEPGWRKADYRKGLYELTLEIDRRFKEHLEKGKSSEKWMSYSKRGYFPNETSLAEITAQLEPVNQFAEEIAYYGLFADLTPTEDQINEMDTTELQRSFVREAIKLLIVNQLNDPMSIDTELRQKLGRTFKQIKANDQVAKNERLFHAAWMSVHNTFEVEVIEPVAQKAGSVKSDVIGTLSSSDFNMAIYYACTEEAKTVHDHLENPEALKNVTYHTVVSIHSQIDLRARVCALQVKYGPELGTYRDAEGELKHRNTACLNYLIRSARSQALKALEECKKLDIPCLAAIETFEKAEISRDDVDKDKIHDVLENYWRSGLTAKALIMSFKK